MIGKGFANRQSDLQNVIKTFSAKITEQGKFAIWIHGYGWSFNAKGGRSALSYEKRIFINVYE